MLKPSTAAALAGLSLLLVACTDFTDPKTPDVSPTIVTGTWSYNATNMSGDGLTCSINVPAVTFSGSGSTFGGTYGKGTISCGDSFNSTFTAGPILGGRVFGNSVVFDFDIPEWGHTGTLSGNTISGTVILYLGTNSKIYVLSGSFSMVRN